MSIGKRLKECREQKNISLREVQDNLKIRIRYLEALENDNFDIIPGEAYTRAFIKSYANFLGIDHQELLAEYQKIKEEEEKQLLENMEEQEKKTSLLAGNKTLLSSIIIILVLVIIIAYLVYYIFNIRNRETGVHPANNVSTNIDNIFINRGDIDLSENNSLDISVMENNELENYIGDNDEQIFEIDEEILSEKDIEEKEIELIVTEETWLQIIVDGKNVFEGTLYKGDNRIYRYKDSISLKIGNAAGLQVKKDNEIYGPWGERSEVVKKVIQ
ncbi:MAG: helix-turn-helix domain-containing protein [Halanaerobiaceae bacterium]|nr:helix-turn-helix domain-containing protein [Halanaerobiaceae bacterium]